VILICFLHRGGELFQPDVASGSPPIPVWPVGMAIDHELVVAVLQRRLDDPRIAVGPVVAALGDQAHPVAVAFQPQAVAIIFHLVQLVRGLRHGGGAGREAEVEGAAHTRQCELSSA
jgi:hypothetical protein